MAKRVQSPSSINTYKQCPRKYFYQYIAKHPTKENIHTVRGNIVHEALEQFFSIDPVKINEKTFKRDLSLEMRRIYDKTWIKAAARLRKLGLLDEQVTFYYTESMQMLANWLNQFLKSVEKEMKKMTFMQAFAKLKPHAMEKEYKNENLMVRGFIDVIQKDGDDVILLDYKTSKTSEVKADYLLQLGIYALLYQREHGEYPKKVGLWFLKDKLITLDVTEELVKNALFNVEQIHFATATDTISDYPKKEGPLCKYSTGQCDFYEVCRGDR